MQIKLDQLTTPMAEAIIQACNVQANIDYVNAIMRAFALAATTAQAQIRAIIDAASGQLIGVVVSGRSASDGRWWLYQLVIDPHAVRLGYGSATIAAFVAELQPYYAVRTLYTCYQQTNSIAQQFLRAQGWTVQATDSEGMVTASLALPPREAAPVAIELRPISLENARACLELRVAPHQTHFVASTAASLVQSKFEPQWTTQGIYADDRLVGFVMYGHDPIYGWGILRLLIDEQFQGRGYGRIALAHVLQAIRVAGGTSVGVSYEAENDVAKRLYQSLGFVETGEQPFGEPFAVLSIDDSAPNH